MKHNLNNEQALELFNTLNALAMKSGSHIEYAATKTLRKMKEWQKKLMERLKDIDDDNCATAPDDKGNKLLIKTTLKNTRDGDIQEYQVNTYTAEGEKKRTEVRRKALAEKASDFEIHRTNDTADLTTYQKLQLTDLGFIDESKKGKWVFQPDTENETEEKESKNTDTEQLN